jgi:hypothetical protein
MPDPSKPIPRRSWQGPRLPGSKSATDKQARMRKIYILGAVILALAATVAGLLFYLREPPRPTIVVLRIDQYRDARVPVSPWAVQDRNALRNLGMQEKNTFTSQERELLKQELADLGKKQPRDQPLVIYLCAYAAVQDDGTVAILPADANLGDQKTWLPFKDVLAALQNCPVKHRLLLLDLAVPCVEPRAGLLAANVPEKLKPVLETAVKDDGNLLVLASCGPGQASLASEEFGHTVFAHFIVEGLAGRADGFPNKKTDNRVTVRELVDYVTMQVDRWAYDNLGLRQTPEFFGNSATDYELTGTDDKKQPEATSLPSEYPSFLQNGWAERDKWWAERRRPTPPKLIGRLERALLNADEHWRKGEDAATIERRLKSETDEIQAERNKAIGPPDTSEPGSLAEAVARGQKPPDGPIKEPLRQLKELGTTWARVNRPAKPEDKPTDRDRDQLKADGAAFLKKYGEKPFDLAWTVFEAALEDKALRVDHLLCWCELVKAEDSPYKEIRFLNQLAKLQVTKPDEFPAAASVALQMAKRAEEVETLNPVKQDWLAAKYAEARQRREAAEKLLFSANPADRARAGKPAEDAFQAFDDLYARLELLQKAQRTRDEALVFLPGYPPCLEQYPDKMAAWSAAVQNAGDLQEMLSKTPKPEQVDDMLKEVRKTESTLRTGLENLSAPLNEAAAPGRFNDRRAFREADAREMRALLRLSALTASQRKTIWTQAREGAGKLNAKFAQSAANAETLQPPNEPRAVREERDRALMRARVSLALLRLDGAADVKNVDDACKDVEAAPQEEAKWEALRRQLRQAWKQHDAGAARR